MLSDYATTYIRNTVSSYLYDNTSFTSLDIANVVKAAGVRVRNREVAEWLRSNAISLAHAQGVLFNQTLIRVDSKADGWTLAYLYHHMNNDADEYLDRDQNPQSYHQGPVTGVLGATSEARDAAAQQTPAIVAASQIGLINQSIARATRTIIVPDSFVSREAARIWVRRNTDYVVDDRGPYSINRWGVKTR